MKYGSRKFIISILILVVATGMAITKLLTPELSTVLLAIVTSYNVVNGWVETRSNGKE